MFNGSVYCLKKYGLACVALFSLFIYIFVIQLGKTKVFLRAGQIGILDSQRAEVLDSAAKCIQGRYRTFIAHRDFISTRAAALSVQAFCRGYFCLLNFFVNC